MDDLTHLGNQFNSQNLTCLVIIETPKRSRSKFRFDPESGLFKLGWLLPEGLAFPYDFGFIPQTRGDDGDPLDMMVLMDEPTHAGCLLEARIVGIIEAMQTESGKSERNDRLVGAALHSYEYADVETIADINSTMLAQLEEFFISYNKQKGRRFKVLATGGPKRAVKALKTGIRNYRKAQQ